MSTRSAIGIKNKKGEVKAIYCHFDGYPEYVGKVLVENYDTTEKVEELLALGDLSSLGERVKPNENETHTFENSVDDVTVAYHRDRGEELIAARTYSSIGKFIRAFEDAWCEFFYVFDNNEWYVYTKVNDGKPVRKVLEGNK